MTIKLSYKHAPYQPEPLPPPVRRCRTCDKPLARLNKKDFCLTICYAADYVKRKHVEAKGGRSNR